MNAIFQPTLDFDAACQATVDGDALILDLEGWEGPLDLLLALARGQKVDLARLSITRLADQYLAFVRQARRRRFALAIDYLVMAAWLAYLKSRLLLPKPERPKEEELPAEQVAAQLTFRLAKLDAMRRAAETLQMGPILKRDVFTRGDPEAVRVVPSPRADGDLHGLMAAFLEPRKRGGDRTYRPKPVQAWRLDDARDHLRRLAPHLHGWTALSQLAPGREGAAPSRASFVASTLSAALELVREGELEARQLEAFAEIWLRAAETPSMSAAA